MTEYFNIGKFAAVHGLKGELLLKHVLGKETTLQGLRAIFLEDRKDSFIPWFISTVRVKTSDEVYMKLEGIDTKEAAARLAKKDVWLTETDFKTFAAPSAPVSLLGYTIINEKEIIGEILEVIEQPHQLLCRLDVKGREVLIPLHEGTLKKIDHKNRQLIVLLPAGLLDIYLT